MIRILAGLVFCLLTVTAAFSAEFEDQIESWSLKLDQIDANIGDAVDTGEELDGYRGDLTQIRGDLRAAISKREAELAPLSQGLEKLGPAPEDDQTEPPGLVEERRRMSTRIEALSAGLRLAQNLELRVNSLIDRSLELRRALFTEQLLTRTPGIFDPGVLRLADENAHRKLSQLVAESAFLYQAGQSTWGEKLRTAIGLLTIVALMVLIFRLKRRAESWLTQGLVRGEPNPHRATISVTLTSVRLVLPSTAFGIAFLWLSNSALIGPFGAAVIQNCAVLVFFVIGACGLSGAYFAPNEPSLRISGLPDRAAWHAWCWVVALAVVVGLDQMFVADGIAALGLSVEALVTINSFLLIPGGISLWMVATILRPARPVTLNDGDGDGEEITSHSLFSRVIGLVRVLVRLAAVASPVLALLGFFSASRFFFFPAVFSGAVLGFAILLFYSVREGVEQFTHDNKSETHQVQLIPVVVGFILTCVAIPILMLIWGATTADLRNVWLVIRDGISVGEIRLSPVDIVGFLIVFSVGYVITKMIQGVMNRNVLPLTGLDSGGRDAVSAGIGYLGITIAVFIAISTAGLDLSNLAIVAGALSVGIGFGLQNIVNNFVSGVILLIERPIKAGDWVELTSGMGYVKKVNVRSTEVQTFDRSTLFVPNSELISGSVINWTHSDMHGRLIVKVGTAYGTDPRKVEKILQEIADA
ncbi:MAG: mechanosensitive ion channel domain-containing protein, partial [Pseudomonadota bacterium]